jgi:hypothetical protein
MVAAGQSSAFYRYVGDAGSGKSSLLVRINEELRGRGFTVVHISGARVRVISAHIEGDPVIEARAVLEQCATIAQLMVEDLTRRQGSPGVVSRSSVAADCVGEAHRHARRLSDLAPEHRAAAGLPDMTGDTSGPGPAEVDPGSQSCTLAWLGQVQRDFGARVKQALRDLQPAVVTPVEASPAGLAVLVDEFDVLAATPAGDWLVALLEGLDRSVRVVAGRPAEAVLEPVDAVLAAAPLQHVPRLSRREVQDYLQARLPVLPADEIEVLLDEVLQVTLGHAIFVAIAADLVEAYGPGTDLRAAFGYHGRELVDRIATEADLDQLGDSLAALLDRLWTQWTVPDPSPVAASVDLLDRMCVVASFDSTILGVLVDDVLPAAEPHEHKRLLGLLEHLSFIVPFDDDEEAGHRVHALVRSRRLRQVQHRDPARFQALHSLMENYYHIKLNSFVATWEADLRGKQNARIRAWHRYEDPRWPSLVNAWLYHLARAGGDPAAIRVTFTRLFFDAFWWYGECVPFPFCDQILAEFANIRHAVVSADGEWLRQVRDFYRTYPRGFQPERADPLLWQRSGAALAYLGAHLPDGTGFRDEQREDLLQCRGLINIYRAEAARFGGAPLAEIEHHYAAAATAFEEVGDEWCALWVRFGSTAALRERDQLDWARTAVPDLQEAIEEQKEYELRVHLAMMIGDIRWAEKDYRAAMDAYARALAHAYAYQVRQETDDQAPSEYTNALYVFVLNRVAECLRALRESVREVEAQVRRHLRVLFAPAVRPAGQPGTDLDQSLSGLVPPPPSVTDFTSTDSMYAHNVRAFLVQRRRQLDEIGVDKLLGDD